MLKAHGEVSCGVNHELEASPPLQVRIKRIAQKDEGTNPPTKGGSRNKNEKEMKKKRKRNRNEKVNQGRISYE